MRGALRNEAATRSRSLAASCHSLNAHVGKTRDTLRSSPTGISNSAAPRRVESAHVPRHLCSLVQVYPIPDIIRPSIMARSSHQGV